MVTVTGVRRVLVSGLCLHRGLLRRLHFRRGLRRRYLKRGRQHAVLKHKVDRVYTNTQFLNKLRGEFDDRTTGSFCIIHAAFSLLPVHVHIFKGIAAFLRLVLIVQDHDIGFGVLCDRILVAVVIVAAVPGIAVVRGVAIAVAGTCTRLIRVDSINARRNDLVHLRPLRIKRDVACHGLTEIVFFRKILVLIPADQCKRLLRRILGFHRCLRSLHRLRGYLGSAVNLERHRKGFRLGHRDCRLDDRDILHGKPVENIHKDWGRSVVLLQEFPQFIHRILNPDEVSRHRIFCKLDHIGRIRSPRSVKAQAADLPTGTYIVRTANDTDNDLGSRGCRLYFLRDIAVARQDHRSLRIRDHRNNRLDDRDILHGKSIVDIYQDLVGANHSRTVQHLIHGKLSADELTNNRILLQNDLVLFINRPRPVNTDTPDRPSGTCFLLALVNRTYDDLGSRCRLHKRLFDLSVARQDHRSLRIRDLRHCRLGRFRGLIRLDRFDDRDILHDKSVTDVHLDLA